MKRILVFAIILAFTCSPAGAQEEKDPYEWVIETYQFPAGELSYGFTSRERGSLRAPPLPAADATAEQIRDFIRKSNSIAGHYLESIGLALPKGALVIFDPETLTLSARLPRIAQSSVHFTATAFQEDASKYISVDQLIFEAPSAVLRGIVERAGKQANHQPLLAELKELVAGGQGRIVVSNRMESRSGQRAKVEQSEDVAVPIDLLADGKDQIEFISEVISTGTVWEIDPVIGADSQSLDLNVVLEHHYAPARKRQEPLTRRGAATVSAAVTDTYNAIVMTATMMMDGNSRLIGVWKPEGLEAAPPADVLQAAFLTADIVAVLPLPNDRLTRFLRDHGETVLPTPEGTPEFEKVSDEIPEGMIVRRFRIPPSFLSNAGGGAGAVADDPFAAPPRNEPRFTIQATVQDILKSIGIPFPPGSSANYISSTSDLIVRNTPENIELVEAYVVSLHEDVQKMVAVSVHIVQAPGSLLRQTAEETRALANHQRAWEALQNDAAVKILNTCWLESRSGQRSKIEAGRNHMYNVSAEVGSGMSSSRSENAEDEAGAPKAEASVRINQGDNAILAIQETQRVGTVLEFEPVIGADGVTVDVNVSLSYDYAAPRLASEAAGDAPGDPNGNLQLDAPLTSFREARVTTAMTLRSGMIRMLGMWRPKGTAEFDDGDILQAAFLRAEIVRLEEEED